MPPRICPIDRVSGDRSADDARRSRGVDKPPPPPAPLRFHRRPPRGLRRGQHVRLRDRDGGSLPLKRGRRPDLQRAAPDRRQPRRGRASERIGRRRQRPHAVERRAAFLDRKPDDRTGHRLIVAIAHFDHRRDGCLLLNDVDRAFAFDHDDFQRLRGGLRRRSVSCARTSRALAGL